jgi:hypothetical protein
MQVHVPFGEVHLICAVMGGGRISHARLRVCLSLMHLTCGTDKCVLLQYAHVCL